MSYNEDIYDSDGWPGSNIGAPSFPPFDIFGPIPRTSENTKKLCDRAVAQAFVNIGMDYTPGTQYGVRAVRCAVRFQPDVMIAAWDRLVALAWPLGMWP